MISQKPSGFEPQKEKIQHPFKVPDNFFMDFKKEMAGMTEKPKPRKIIRFYDLTIKVGKYAAILVFTFFAVKGIVSTFQSKRPTETISNSDNEIDAIYSQISEHDITEFLVNESDINITEILDFNVDLK